MTSPVREEDLRDDVPTILRALAHHCRARPSYEVLTWVDANCRATNRLTYQELDDASNSVAAHLLKLGCQKGDRVMIAYPFGLEFLAGLFGCMKIGVIGCSIYPPNPKKIGSEMQKFNGFVEDAGAKIALSTNAFAMAMKAFGMVYSSKVKWVGTDNLARLSSSKIKQIQRLSDKATAEDVAFIQYTSGSTGSPKGVMIPHSALVENTKAFSDQCRVVAGKTVGALWLPQYHDMGLIGGFMTSVYSAFHLIMASPIDFITKPLLWTDMVEKYKADLTGAPNFAYALLLKRLQQTGQTADWSHVTRAFFGAEPTQTKVVEGVIETLGIKPEHVFNNYGMAESVVFLTGGVAKTAEDGLVSCGDAISSTLQLRIVDQGKVVPEGEVGTIWAQSLRVASGYYGKEDVTNATFKNTIPGEESFWLDTGDLGKVVDGKLFVTGRVKDVIIVNGKNYYPTDVEISIEQNFHHLIRPGRTAVFQMTDDTIGVLVEARDEKKVKGSDVDVSISKHVLQEHGLVTERVLVMTPGAAPKTTSGKLKRSQIKSKTIEDDWDSKLVLLSHHAEKTLISASKRCPPSLLRVSSPRDASNNQDFLSHELKSEATIGSLPVSSDSRDTDDLAAIIKGVTGSSPDMDKTWTDNGLASIKAAELVARIQERFHVDIPSNFADIYPTPQKLQEFLSQSEGTAFETVKHESVQSKPTLSIQGLCFLQGIGMIAIVVLLALSFFPSFFLGRAVRNFSVTFEIGSSGRYVTWSYLPLVVPTFCLTFTAVVILLKWLIVGSYKTSTFQVHSWQYLCWWFMDRLLDMWEAFVGVFFLDTQLLWLVYKLMGAEINPSVSINSFIREFDLVQIGEGSTLSHQLRCRKFCFWDESEESPTMVLYPISIGKHSTISGMLGPGCSIGNNCQVDSLSAVADGAIVPDGVVARGSPAYNCGNTPSNADIPAWHWHLAVLKLLWLVIEVYLFFGLFLVAQVIMNQQLPPQWRYTPLLYWMLVMLITAALAVVVSILLKWVLIGKRQPGSDKRSSIWGETACWACDYHFRMCMLMLLPVSGASWFWLVVLKLHGLDIDYSSVINGFQCFPPSTVDLIKIRQSFVSVPSFDIDTSKSMIEIIDSSVGYNCRIYSGAQIVRSTLPPKTPVREGVYDSNHKSFEGNTGKRILMAVLSEAAQLVLNVAIFVAMIPSYEVFINTVFGASTVLAVFGLLGALLAHVLSLSILLFVVEGLMTHLPHFIQRAVFGVYAYHVWANKVWSLWYLLHGTPMFKYWLRLMGAEVNGMVWYFGSLMYDIPKLHFIGRVVVDDSHLSGHFVLPDGLTIDDTYVSGLVHPGSYAYAGAHLAKREYKPYSVFHPTTMTKNERENNITAQIEISLSSAEVRPYSESLPSSSVAQAEV